MRIDYTFAVAMKLVTVAEFKKFRPDFPYVKNISPGEDTPMNNVSWYDAAGYCNDFRATRRRSRKTSGATSRIPLTSMPKA